MPQRPCKPDADMKRLWQALLPGTPMPVCGTAEDDNADAVEDLEREHAGRDKEALKRQAGR